MAGGHETDASFLRGRQALEPCTSDAIVRFHEDSDRVVKGRGPEGSGRTAMERTTMEVKIRAWEVGMAEATPLRTR